MKKTSLFITYTEPNGETYTVEFPNVPDSQDLFGHWAGLWFDSKIVR